MDRPVSRSIRQRRLVRRYAPAALALAATSIGLIAVLSWVRPSVSRSDIRTAVVERGPVEETVAASGSVVPEYEHVITSPIDTRVTRILKTPGDSVQAGEPIVLLDVSASQLGLETLEDRISIKRIDREKARQSLASRVSELKGQRDIKALELESLEFQAERCRQNLEKGLFSKDDLRKAESDEERARIELRQIEESISFAEQAFKTQLEGLDLELSILQKERDEAAHRLALATAVSDRDGVLTSVISSEGMAVKSGDEIARVADLSAFRVEATVSDIHGSRIAPGQPATVQTGDIRMQGRVENVRPTVENGVITLDVALLDNRNPILRHNLRVEVYVVTAFEENSLRVARGQFVNVDGVPCAFVLRTDVAVRIEVRFGLRNFEYYEVLEGLDEGDEVIISDMRDYQHVKEVRLK